MNRFFPGDKNWQRNFGQMLCLAALCLPSLTHAKHTTGEYRLVSDIAYLGNTRKEKMDAYLPVREGKDNTKKTPAVLFIHGGGWAKGSKSSPRSKHIATTLAKHGFAVYCLDYQLTKFVGKPWQSEIQTSSWPQNIYDCKTAVRYIRKQASRDHIDPSRIAVMGCSAGGHLALLTGLSAENNELNAGGLYQEIPCHVKCVIEMYGVPDIRLWGGEALLKGDPATHRHQWDLASPVTHLSPKTPPILILHGDQDKTVDVNLSRNFATQLKKRGIAHRFVEVQGGVHSFDLQPPQKDLRPIVVQFLKKH